MARLKFLFLIIPIGAACTKIHPTATEPKSVTPMANTREYSTDEDTPLEGVLSASGTGNSPLFVVKNNPQHGQVILTEPREGKFTYTPNKDFNGNDTFNFAVESGGVSSTPSTVNIAVSPINDPPQITNPTLLGRELLPTLVDVTTEDPDSNQITIKIVTQPKRGILEIQDKTLVYYTVSGFSMTGEASDSFELSANDGELTSPVKTMTIQFEE